MTDRKPIRRTKIVATLGPGTGSREAVLALCRAGANVFRVNSSHGSRAGRAALIRTVRDAAAGCDSHAAVLLDLQGPRIRVGELAAPLTLERGAEVVFAPDDEAVEGEISTTYHALADDVVAGSRILMDDGLLVAEVLRTSDRKVIARVMHGGVLTSHKGMNLPGVKVSAPAITEKDREDIALGVELEVDYIGVSFVRRSADVETVRSLIPDTMGIVAKIEKDEALDDLEGIVTAADAVMVARGDLGVELPYEEVPLAQKRVIGTANRLGRPVITATQMLESMVSHPRPTRAEASDVANAILDGTDAVMLSAETAVGDYPVEAVTAMVRIITEIEGSSEKGPPHRRRGDFDRGSEPGVDDAIALATCAAAEMLSVPLILCFTRSGFTARKIATFRPRTPILALSKEPGTCRQLSLVWGVIPELTASVPNYEEMLESARIVLEKGAYARSGDKIVVTAGVPFDVPGTTNLLKVEVV